MEVSVRLASLCAALFIASAVSIAQGKLESIAGAAGTSPALTATRCYVRDAQLAAGTALNDAYTRRPLPLVTSAATRAA